MRNHGPARSASNGDGVLRSADGGASWRGGHGLAIGQMVVLALLMDAASPQTTDTAVLSLAMDPNRPVTLYAGTVHGGVFVTDDGCQTWTQAVDGLFNATITSLAVDPFDSKVVYAGTEGGGVFRMVRTTLLH